MGAARGVDYAEGGVMEWTTDKPTESGWYWVYFIPVREPTIECAFVQVMPDNEIYVELTCDGLGRVTHWMGPLVEPLPPDPEFYTGLMKGL